MPDLPLSRQANLDAEAMWRTTRNLVDRFFGVIDGDDAMDDCLDALVDVLGADRGLLLLTSSDGGVLAINGRGKGEALTTMEREEVSRTIVREAIETRRCVQWDPLSAAAGQSSSFVSLASWPRSQRRSSLPARATACAACSTSISATRAGS